jgi:hypothetical protein
MNDDQRNDLLKGEYIQLHRAIEEFDGRPLTIKAWSVSFSLAALVGAFISHSPAILLVSSLSACLFWFIECTWKTFQYAFYARMNEIENFYAGKAEQPAPFQIGRSWYDRWSQLGRVKMCRMLCWPHVALPHAVVAALGCCCSRCRCAAC